MHIFYQEEKIKEATEDLKTIRGSSPIFALSNHTPFRQT
jgi:hypothetical protein